MPIARLSPTLRALACHRQRPGFTALEVVAAIGISSIVILSAVAAVRAASSTMSQVSRVSRENALLRTGFEIALNDIDFWNSEGNPNPPYNKGYTRAKPGPSGNNYWGTSHEAGKGPFQGVVFRRSTSPNDLPFRIYNKASDIPTPEQMLLNRGDPNTTFTKKFLDFGRCRWAWNPIDDGNEKRHQYRTILNPNILLPHDPRTWNRASIFNRQMASHPGQNYPRGQPSIYQASSHLVSAVDMRYYRPNATKSECNPVFPINNEHDPGNITLNLDYDLDNVSDPSPEVLTHTPSTSGGLTDAQAWPDNYGYSGVVPINSCYNQWSQLFKQQMCLTFNWAIAMEYQQPGATSRISDWKGTQPSARHAYRTYDWYGNYSRTPGNDGNIWAGDKDRVSLLGPTMRSGSSSKSWMMFPNQFRTPEVYSTCNSSYADLTRLDYAYLNDPHVFMVTNEYIDKDFARNAKHYSNTTIWMPFDHTNPYYDRDPTKMTLTDPMGKTDANIWVQKMRAVDYSSRPKGMPILTHTTFRRQLVGGAGQLNSLRITVEEPENGSQIELVFTAMSTSYRGARQHWRLYSPAYVEVWTPVGGKMPADMPAGDFYSNYFSTSGVGLSSTDPNAIGLGAGPFYGK